ncbi:MAG TPA: hypothetical protein DDW17_05085 [Deltaproteobacteria bacterium]|nr:hypothetical protein [Deltaproteobacteria bacterium]
MQSRSGEGYKNVRMHVLVPTSSGFGRSDGSTEPKPSIATPRDTKLRKEHEYRVPVVSVDGNPLMPTTPAKARKLIKGKQAIGKWSKLGIFYIQMQRPVGDRTQEVAFGLDPGSKFEGVAVVSKEKVLQTGMNILPKGIVKKLEQKRRQRRFRRYRKTWRRPARFDNRTRAEGWIAPSQKAKVDFRLKIIEELKKLYPITKAVVEDVRFNHYKKRWGKHFSTVEIGKKRTYDKLIEWFGEVRLISGVETGEIRKEYRAKKVSEKREKSVYSHAIDAVVIAAKETGLGLLMIPSFFIWRRYQYPRRQLHKSQFKKGGIRRREGGSNSMEGFRKGDVVLYRGELARGGGYREGIGLSLHQFDTDNKRFTQRAKPSDCIRLFNQKIMYEQPIPPTTEVVGFLGGAP